MIGILTTLIGLVAFVLVLGLIVLVHELGHFYFAKKAGILCHEFAIGMGPVVWQKRKGETMYSIRAIPIGGFVSMAGEEVESNLLTNVNEIRIQTEGDFITKIVIDLDDARYEGLPRVSILKYDLIGTKKALKNELFLEYRDDDGKTESMSIARDAMVVVGKGKEIQITPYDRSFSSKNVSQRFFTILAGPMMNFILAIVLFFIIGLVGQFPVLESSVIDGVEANTPIHAAGLTDGDEIIKIGTFVIEQWSDISDAMASYKNNFTGPIPIEFKRGSETLNTSVNPQVIIFSAGFVSDFTITDKVVIGRVNSPARTIAEKAGLASGDEIKTISIGTDVITVTSWQDVIDAFSSNLDGTPVVMQVQRGLELVNLEFTPYNQEVLDVQGLTAARLQLSIVPIREFDLGKSVGYAFTGTLSAFTFIFDTLKLLVSNSQVGVDDLSGPLGIMRMTSEVAKQGLIPLLNWTAILSVNVGFINLLPIPALDGSRLAFLGYEAVAKKPINRRIENLIHTVGLILLMGLFVFVTWNDFLRDILGVK